MTRKKGKGKKEEGDGVSSSSQSASLQEKQKSTGQQKQEEKVHDPEHQQFQQAQQQQSRKKKGKQLQQSQPSPSEQQQSMPLPAKGQQQQPMAPPQAREQQQPIIPPSAWGKQQVPLQQQPQRGQQLPTGPPPGWGHQQQKQQAPQIASPGFVPPTQQNVPSVLPQVGGGGKTVEQGEGATSKGRKKGKGEQPAGKPIQQQQGEQQQQVVAGGVMTSKQLGVSDTPRQQPSASGTPRQQPRASDTPSQSQQLRGRQESVSTITTKMSQVALTGDGDVKPMDFKKFEPGKRGRKIPVETNHLVLNLGKLTTAIHYDVKLVPDTPKKYLRNVMTLFREKYYPKRWPAFDGRKNLYSSSMLPFGEAIQGEVILQEKDGREKKYVVEVKYANHVDLSPLKNYELSRATPREALQVVDIVLRSAPAQSLISVGQSFFLKPPNIIDLGEGMEMYSGFYQTAIRGWKPFLNVDVAHKAFPKDMPVVDALVEVLGTGFSRFSRDDLSRPLDRRDQETFEKFIKTLSVHYEIPGIPSSRRRYRVNGLKECAANKKFTLDNGQQTTIEQYFTTQKRFRLKYPMLPTLWVGDRNRPNPILLPMELCRLEEGQVLNRKMTENQTSKMIKHAATDTDTRKSKIYNGVRQANFNAHPSIKEFGFSVSDVFEKLDARVLDPPKLGYAGNRPIAPSRGVWRGDRFFQGATINTWTIVAADRRPPKPDDFAKLEDALFRNAGPSGLTMTTRAEKPYQTIGNTIHEIKKYFQNQKGKYDVIFVIVPNSGQQYSYVKSAAEINVGCLTQCVKSKTVFKMNPQTAINILLKVNAKMNGTNHILLDRPKIMNRPIMIMGADVTHPSPDATHIPSVAAVTASHDPKAFKYNICWRLQPPKQEIIDDLENITLEHLKYFHDQNRGMKPERIVFFRDGVSEGQFEYVRNEEIRAIRSACKKMQTDGYEPSITFLVVQKRHHTRLFPVNPRDSEDRNKNVPAGTCVDYMITHPFLQDFYLVSHASIQGVAKPTKYCTLWDDNDLSNDDIEELTYFLCHMFTRCNRSVSYPAPTYYAHLAAARAKVYIENDNLDLDNLQREYEKYQIQDVIRKGKPMFFV